MTRKHSTTINMKQSNVKNLEADKTLVATTGPKNQTSPMPILHLDCQSTADKETYTATYQRVNLQGLAKMLFYIKHEIYHLKHRSMLPADEKRRFRIKFAIMVEEVEKCISRSVHMNGMTYHKLFARSYQLEAKYNQVCREYALTRERYEKQKLSSARKTYSSALHNLMGNLFSCCF